MTAPKRVAIVGAALSDIGRVDTKTPYELHYQAASRALADAASGRTARCFMAMSA